MIIEEKVNAKHLTMIILSVIVGMILGAVFSAIYYSGKTIIPGTANDTSQAKNCPGFPEMKIPDTVTGISGKVDKIDGKTLTVTAFFYGQQKKYTVKITDNTKIMKRELNTNSQPPKQGEQPISPFKETAINLSDIKTNSTISAESAENIKDKTSFEAKTIYLDMSFPTAPPAK